jgi:hypothetical protein
MPSLTKRKPDEKRAGRKEGGRGRKQTGTEKLLKRTEENPE